MTATDTTPGLGNTFSAVVKILTPKLAQDMLVFNVGNRPLNDTTVARYRRDMIDGNWTFAADPIRFSRTERLLDGQHRLAALAGCPEGTAIAFLIIRDLEDDSQGVMDQGRKRSPGDQLALHGVKDYNIVAAGVKTYLIWREGLLFRDNKAATAQVTTPRIERWVAEHHDLVLGLASSVGPMRRVDAPPSVVYAAAIAFHQINPHDSAEFFRLLAVGAGGETHPITVLDKRLQRHRREGLKLSARDCLSLFILAWNAWREGRTLSKFQKPKGASWTAESFPEPK